MTITGKNEVAVENQMRRAEKQSQPLVTGVLEGAESATQAISLVTGSGTIGCIAKAFGIAKRFTSELGVATLAENLDHLGDATETALSRVEKNLEAQGVWVDEIERRLKSNELFEGIKAATLQAQRTADKKRLERMALILANGVAENDLESESLDDMMRAAVELRNVDIQVLKKIYEQENKILKDSTLDDNKKLSKITEIRVDSFGNGQQTRFQIRGAIARLQSLGLIQFRTPGFDAGAEIVVLLPEGSKFYERLQKIAADPEEVAL